MKKVILVLGLLFSSVLFAQTEKTYVKCDLTNSITYTKTSENGVVLETGTFNEFGKYDGTWKQYDSRGNLLLIAKFENGIKHGVWRHWFRNKYAEVLYKEGRRVSSKLIIERNYIASN